MFEKFWAFIIILALLKNRQFDIQVSCEGEHR